MEKLLEVKNLKVELKGKNFKFYPVDNVTFNINKGEIIGIVGESGCGKTMTALSIIGLLPKKISSFASGKIILEGIDLIEKGKKGFKSVRGKKIGMIFQDPMTSLNPTLTVKHQICETIIKHKKISKSKAVKRALELLRLVEIPSPENVINYYPYQLSGGMRQRVVIAIAISCDPILLIADEPTTALDITIQKQIILLLKKLKKEINASMLIISHDLNIIAELCSKVMVMYAGKIVEKTNIVDIFKEPAHPYAEALFKCIPRIDKEYYSKIESIKGLPPDFVDLPTGCRFNPRCKYANENCQTAKTIDLIEIKKDHEVACLNPLK